MREATEAAEAAAATVGHSHEREPLSWSTPAYEKAATN